MRWDGKVDEERKAEWVRVNKYTYEAGEGERGIHSPSYQQDTFTSYRSTERIRRSLHKSSVNISLFQSTLSILSQMQHLNLYLEKVSREPVSHEPEIVAINGEYEDQSRPSDLSTRDDGGRRVTYLTW